MHKKCLILTLFLFLIICFLTPISGDDFGNYISTTGKLSEAIHLAISYYEGLEGRFVGRIIIMFTTYHKVLWNIITPLIFFLMICSISKLIKNKNSFIVLLIGLLLVNHDMFSQSYTWLAGSITYLYPTALIIFYFIYIKYHHDNFKKIDYFILPFLSIIIPMFVENLGCSFVLGNLILVIYEYVKKKKIKVFYLINFLISLIFLIIMLKSPGSADRSLTENLIFNELNLFEKIFYNLGNFNLYVFFKNSLMIVITLIPIVYYLIKKDRKIFAIVLCIIPILNIIGNIYYLLPMKFSFLQNINLIDSSNGLYIIYILVYICLFILTINYIVRDKFEKEFIYFILLLGLSSVGSMLIIPTWGDRITLFNTVIFTTIGCILIDKIIPSGYKLTIILKGIYSLVLVYFITCFIGINQINNYRENYIYKQLDEDLEVIEVIRNPLMYIWNNNPGSDYFIRTYKGYMSIPKEKEIEIVYLPYKEYIKIILGGIK